jgi:nitroreductase
MAGELFDLAETDRLLATTRAVRKRLDLDRPVERDVVLDCLRLAVQAPTGGNQQGWRWMVVTDADKRAAIADAYNAAGAGYLKMASENPQQDPQTKRVYESAYALTETLARVPVHVIPCIQGRIDLGHNGTAAAAYGSILPAVWSFNLALRSRGLGSVFTTLHLFKEKEVGELLGIPQDFTQVALLPVAYTLGTDFKPGKRKPLDSMVHWDAW